MSTTPLDPAALQDLRTRVKGPVIAPGDAAYDGARAIWNAMIDRRPEAIAQCVGTSDVVQTVKFAREKGLPLSIRAGGHNISGLALADDALLLDLSLMRGVMVDRDHRIAYAQGGALLGDIDRETQLHGLAAALGFVSLTGGAGLTLGGGFGYLSRRFGWTSDGLRGVEMVTASGDVVRASEKENADLFWGLRGGGGNFGVVTRFDHALQPVGPEIVGGGVAWLADPDAAAVLEMYRALAMDAPRELAVVCVVRPAPPAPWIAKEAHGKTIVALFVCWSGDLAEGDRIAAKIKSVGTPVGSVLQRRTYVSQQSFLDATQPKGRRYYWKSEYLPAVTPELLEGVLAHGRKISSPHSAVVLFPMGGAIGDLPADHSAVGNRDASFVLNVTAAWDKAEEDATHVEWARAAWRDLRRFSTGGTYVNFLTEEEGDERIRAAYGGNYARLAEIKAKWDPENVFRMNKNVAPKQG